MGRKRKTRWRRLSIGEISANEEEDGELGVAVISLTRSHSASQNHSPARHPSDKALSAVITMTNNNKDSSSTSPSLHTSSTNLSSAPGGGGDNSGGGPNSSASGTNAKLLSGSSASTPPTIPDKSQIPSQNPSPSPNPHSQSNNSGYHNGHNHVPSSYNNSTHPPPNSVSSNESTSSSTGGGGAGGGGHYNDRYHYTRENYRPPHHHHHHHHHHNHHGHNSNYNGPSSSSHYQGSGEGGSSSRGERGSYHYSGHPHSHKEYQNGYHGPGHYSGYQGNSYCRSSQNNYRNSHYSGGGSGSGGGAGGEPYNGGESEGYHYPPSSRPYGGRFRKSRSYPASSYYYANGSSKSSGGASNSDNINRPSYNQDEYTKITTPRQDVLFKKGYLSQKKTQPSSSSVDSVSAATTPSASTNGTPDTQSTNGINSDNSEGYENGETDYVIPYDDTIYYAPAPPPEAVFTDPNTGQVYYGHCSSTGEYYDAYPVSPVMVAAGYPPVYYPMMPYGMPSLDWNAVPAPMYPMVAAPPPPHQLPPEDSSLLSPGLQGLESSPATTTNPNTNSDPSADPSSNQSSAVSNNASSTNSNATPITSAGGTTTTTRGHDEDGEEDCDETCRNKEGLGSDSGLDSGSSVADDAVSSSAATSQGNSSGAEEECVGGNTGAKVMSEEETPKSNVRSKKQHLKQSTSSTNNNNNNSESVGKKVCVEGGGGTGKEEDNNNEGGRKVAKLVQDVEKLHLSKRKDDYSSSESVLSSASSTDSGNASPPTIKGDEQVLDDETMTKTTTLVDPTTSALSPANNAVSYNNSNAQMKGMMMISSQHPQHLTSTGIQYNTTGGPHPQGIQMAAGPVMTTVPLQMGCPPVMIAAAPNGMPLPPLVSATPIHHMTHPPPPPLQNGGPGHHPSHHHYHGGNHPNHGPHPHHPHNNHHMHHHPSSHHPHQHHQPHHHNHQHSSHGPPPPNHHPNYSHHHNHLHNPRHHGPHNHHQNSPGQHHQPHHQMPPPLPSQAPNLPPSQSTAPQQGQQPSAVALGSAGPPPPPGSTPYHVYPHPTAYVYGPPHVYNDEGSAATSNGLANIPTATDTCANLETTASTTTTSDTTFITYQVRDSKGERKTVIPTKGTGEKTTTERQQDNNGIGEGESKSISATLENRRGLPAYRAEGAGTTTATGSGREGKKQSCDFKLENIIASKEFNPEKTAVESEEGAIAKFNKKGGPSILQTSTTTTSSSSSSSPPLRNSYSAEETDIAVASLTLESPNKMNTEIEIHPLKLDTSGAEREKVGSPSSPPPPQLPIIMGESKSVGAEVRNEKLKDAASVLTSLTLSPASTSSSSPSSANESSTSSPVNDGSSLMRSQSKLAARKKFTSEEASESTETKGIGESCHVDNSNKGSNNNYNSRKKQRKTPAPCPLTSNSSLGSHHTSNNNNETKPERDKPPNLLESDHRKSKKGKVDQPHHQQKPVDNNEEDNKTSSVPADETCQEGGQGSQNQMTSSNDSGQLPQESCSSSSTTTNTTSPQQESGEMESINLASGSCGSGSLSLSSSLASRKPTDLTVQCPLSIGNDDGQYETLQLQQSPSSLANEPSSPDSLNTNQSVAGSEFAPGENLSMSESDFMNRTTSIDEIEEDLPHEVELPIMGSELVAVTVPSLGGPTTTNLSTEEALDKNSATTSDSPLSSTTPTAPADVSQNIPAISSEPPPSNVELESPTNIGPNLEEAGPAENVENPEDNDKTTSVVVTAEEAIKSNTTTASPKATPSSFSNNFEDNSVEKAKGEKGDEVPLRPQSITLAVTEWLKTQGDDALTPIIARASSSDEFEGDVEETTDSDDEDFDDDDDDDNVQESQEGRQGSGRKRDDKASNLEQNQKNVYGNPWVAPSNKSGSSNGKVTRRRSGSKKSTVKATEKEGNGTIASFPKKDGVCSRVAPHLSSNKLSTSSTVMTTSASVDSSPSGKNYKMNCIINNKYLTAQTSTCSASTSDDQDENYLTDNNYKDATNIPRKKDKHEEGLGLTNSIDTSNNNYLKTTAKTWPSEGGEAAPKSAGIVKDYDSGLELSSPENSSSSESDKSSNALVTVVQTGGNGTIINHKPSMSDSPVYSAPAPLSALIMENNNNDKKWAHSSMPHHHHPHPLDHNKYINTDQVVIAAPLTIVETHSTKAPSCSHKKTGNVNESERKGSDSSVSSPSSLSLRNHNAGRVSQERSNNGDAQSPVSAPSSFASIDDRDHAEICDPQRYAKYYQLGVVFDTSDDPDQGIDTAGEEDEGEMDFLEDMALDSSPPHSISSTPTNSHPAERDNARDKDEQREPHHHHHHQQQQQKNADDFPAVMIQRNRKLARKAKKGSGGGGGGDPPEAASGRKREHNNGDVLVSKSVYLQDQEDEEIGTFDPKAVLESRRRRASFGPLPPCTDDDDDEGNNAEDALDYIADTALVTSSATPGVGAPQQPHLYVNPLSLAAELSGSEMVKVGMSMGNNNSIRTREGDGDDDDDDSDSSSFTEEPPLPPYESPPSVEIPVYNATTPAARVIRQNMYAIGDPVSGAICCSIQ